VYTFTLQVLVLLEDRAGQVVRPIVSGFPGKKKKAREFTGQKIFAAGMLPPKIFQRNNVRPQKFFEPEFLLPEFFRTGKKVAGNFSLQRKLPVILAHNPERHSWFTMKTADPGSGSMLPEFFRTGFFGPGIFSRQKFSRKKVFSTKAYGPKNFSSRNFYKPEIFRSEKKVRDNFWARARMDRPAVQENPHSTRLRRYIHQFRAHFSRFA
jgi:hypothetical protein